jgi:hypothetical protein
LATALSKHYYNKIAPPLFWYGIINGHFNFLEGIQNYACYYRPDAPWGSSSNLLPMRVLISPNAYCLTHGGNPNDPIHGGNL